MSPIRPTSVLVLLVAACSEPKAPAPAVAGRSAMPACPRGTFMAEVDAIFPSMAPVTTVTLVPPQSIDKQIEPGCVVPFRNEPDERVLDVGRVIGKTMRRSAFREKAGDKPLLVGRGRLQIGRRALHVTLTNDAGDETLDLSIDRSHVRLRERGKAPFEGDVSLDGAEPLPLPLDALIAAVDVCDGDLRLGRTQDGNVIEARRGEHPLWRSRWMDAAAAGVIDTSVACDENDARLLWRTAAGDLLPMIAVASARSDRVLVLSRQGPAQVDENDPFGVYR